MIFLIFIFSLILAIAMYIIANVVMLKELYHKNRLLFTCDVIIQIIVLIMFLMFLYMNIKGHGIIFAFVD
jgi:hypothetical protein